MLVIPLIDTPAQSFNVLLDNQFCQLTLYQKSTGFFGELRVQDRLILGGRIWEDRNRFVRDAYLGFIGDLAFVDTQGRDDPSTPGLGTRFILVYYSAAELVT